MTRLDTANRSHVSVRVTGIFGQDSGSVIDSVNILHLCRVVQKSDTPFQLLQYNVK